jgi:hypothetical protein
MRYPGKETELRMGDGGATEAFTKIAQLRSIGPLSFTQNTESVVDHDSAEHAEEHVETTKDYGTVPFEGHWDPAETTHADTVAGLLGRFQAGGIRNYQLAWPQIAGDQTCTIAASIANLAIGAFPVDGKIPLAGEFKITGVPVWA